MFKLNSDIIITLKQKFSSAQNISIIGHSAPDADAVSSVLATYLFLQKMAPLANIIPILPDDPPQFLFWLPEFSKLVVGEKAERILQNSDLIIGLDFNEPKRVEPLDKAFTRSEAFKVVIDHHPDPADFCDVLISFPNAGSTTEILFQVLSEIDNSLIDKQIATCIFTGIITDTGCFCHDSAQANTFITAAKLLSYGVDKGQVIQNIYNNFSYDRMRLMGYVLYKKFKIIPQYHFGYISLSEQELKQFNYKFGDHENFVNLPLSVKDVKISAMFMERQDLVRVSLRSLGNIDVGSIARKYLGGGGHKNAAGGNMDLPLENAVNKFINEILPKAFDNEN